MSAPEQTASPAPAADDATQTQTSAASRRVVAPAPTAGPAGAAPIGDAAPRYEILGEHGRGGLGKVLRAHDRTLGRDVAIKELLARSPLAEVRFLREAMITARLEHPGIVPVHEAGRWPDGTPFYAMKLVSGRPLRELIAERRSVDDRLTLLPHLVAVADALAYAHDRRVIHRDLKPANILVGAFGETVVIDWGLAKDLAATDDPADPIAPATQPGRPLVDDLTAAGAILGTPAYMPPEQARGEPVDARADVFALGAVLWELCSLDRVPPTDRPLRHRKLRDAGVDRDLIAILDKALAPAAADRYPHAGALVADLRAFVSGARVASRSYSLLALLAHWVRRHRALAATLAAALTAGALGIGGYVYQVTTAQRRTGAALATLTTEHAALRTTERLAEDRLTQLTVNSGRLALLDGKYSEALVYLAEAQRRGSRDPSVAFMLARAAEPRLHEVRRLTLPNTWMWSTAFSPDRRWIVSTDDHGAALWLTDPPTDQPTWRLPHDDAVFDAAFAAGGRQLVTAGRDGVVKRWDVASGTLLRALRRPDTPRNAARDLPATYDVLALAQDGRWIAALDTRYHRLDAWSHDDQPIRSLPVACSPCAMTSRADDLAIAVADGAVVSVIDTRTWAPLRTLAEPDAMTLRFAPRGAVLAVATPDSDVALWDTDRGVRTALLHGAGYTITTLAFSPDGNYVAAGMAGGSVRIWNAQTHRRYMDLRGSRPPAINAVAFDSASTRLVAVHGDGTGIVADLASKLVVTTFQGDDLLRAAQFDPVGRQVIAASWDGTVRLWDAAPLYRQWTTPTVEGDCKDNLVRDDDRGVIAIECRGSATWVWNTSTRRLLARLPIDDSPGAKHAPAAVSVDGAQVAIARGHTAAVYEVSDALDGGRLIGTVTHPDRVNAVAFAPRTHDLASASLDGTLIVTPARGAPIRLPSVAGVVDALGWLDDHRLFVAHAPSSTSDHSRVRVIDVPSGRPLAEHDLPIRAQLLRRSASGHRLLILAHRDRPGSPVLWSTARLAPIAPLDGHRGMVFSARFVDDDRQILTSCGDSVVRRWDAADGRLLASYTGPVYIADALLDADTKTLIGAGGDGALYVWAAEAPSSTQAPPLLWSLPAHRSEIVALRLDGRELVTRSARGEISRWALGPPPPRAVIDELVRCAPVRVASAIGLVAQPPCVPRLRP